MAVVLNQAAYQAGTANPAELKRFILQMITEGGRGITGENDVGYSSLPQIYADLVNRGIDLAGLPSLQEVAADPNKYKGIAGGNPTLDNPTQPPKAPTPAVPVATADGKDALKQELDTWGLGALTDQAWALQTSGAGHDQILAWLRGTQEYKTRFAGMAQRAANGLTPISEAQYVSLEGTYSQIAHQYGLLPGSYDPAKAIGGDVSPTEFSQRASAASTAVFDEPQQVRDMLLNYYGLDQGQIASYYLNADNAVPRLQNMLHSAEIGGVGNQLGIGIDKTLAEKVAQAGFTGQSARAGLAQVAANSQLYGESITEQNDLTAQDAVGAAFGLDAKAALALQNRQQKRAAVGQGGGGGTLTSSGDLGERVAR